MFRTEREAGPCGHLPALYHLFCAPPRVHAESPGKTQRGWPLRLAYLCAAGRGGYYIRLLSKKIILPRGLLGFSPCICQAGSHAAARRKRTVWIHTNTPCFLFFLTHPSVFLIKTTTRNRYGSPRARKRVCRFAGCTLDDERNMLLYFTSRYQLNIWSAGT